MTLQPHPHPTRRAMGTIEGVPGPSWAPGASRHLLLLLGPHGGWEGCETRAGVLSALVCKIEGGDISGTGLRTSWATQFCPSLPSRMLWELGTCEETGSPGRALGAAPGESQGRSGRARLARALLGEVRQGRREGALPRACRQPPGPVNAVIPGSLPREGPSFPHWHGPGSRKQDLVASSAGAGLARLALGSLHDRAGLPPGQWAEAPAGHPIGQRLNRMWDRWTDGSKAVAGSAGVSDLETPRGPAAAQGHVGPSPGTMLH